MPMLETVFCVMVRSAEALTAAFFVRLFLADADAAWKARGQIRAAGGQPPSIVETLSSSPPATTSSD